MHKDMKKILFVTLLILPFYAHATDMCARDDVMFFVLDAAAPKSKGQILNTSGWSCNTSSGRIEGDSTCLSDTESSENAIAGLKGTDSNGNERKKCYCNLTHPFKSNWVLASTLASANECAGTGCANKCNAVFWDKSLLSSLINAIEP